MQTIDVLPGCDTCPAPCCSDVAIALTDDEAALLQGGGTCLIPVPPSEARHPVPDGRSVYQMVGRCAFSQPDDEGQVYCTIYPNRPANCRELTEQGFRCLVMQAHAGVISIETLKKRERMFTLLPYVSDSKQTA